MSTSKTKFNAFVKALASSDVHKQVQSFLTDLYKQFETIKPDYFKQEHREEFLRLRTQCRDLINQTRGFCDKAIPPLEYAIAQYNSPNPVNVKELAEKVLSKVDPKNVLDQCEKVENAIMTFNDRIESDQYYKNTNIKAFLTAGSGAASSIASLIYLFFAPVVLEVKITLAALGFLVNNVAFPGLDLFCSGLDQVRAVNNFKQCKQNMIEIGKYVTEMKKELSDATQNHGRLEIRLDMQDVHDLKPIYEDILMNMKRIRDLCLKPFPVI